MVFGCWHMILSGFGVDSLEFWCNGRRAATRPLIFGGPWDLVSEIRSVLYDSGYSSVYVKLPYYSWGYKLVYKCSYLKLLYNPIVT